MVGRYEEALANEAKRLGLDGVICGHIHKPIIRRIDDIVYINDGDWVDRHAQPRLLCCADDDCMRTRAARLLLHSAELTALSVASLLEFF